MEQPFTELVLALQTSLDIESQLAIFAAHLKTAVPHDGYAYRHEDRGLHIQNGIQSEQVCRFNLHVDNGELGELHILRSKPFSESERALIEAFACRLIYPLRNALAYREAINSAYVDPLTRTGNRSALFGSMQREWDLATRHGMPLSIIMLDIDHFKAINDTYGHSTGDSVLREVAGCISETVRSSDIVFRYGGEEFLILLANTSESGALQLAERIRVSLERRLHLPGDGVTLKVTASFGVATLESSESKEHLVERADKALYQAKGTGRNRCCLAQA